MTSPVVVVGAGVGGLTAAIRLAQAGRAVTLFDHRTQAGGLASGLEAGGRQFDGGPYILLDKSRLDWSMHELGMDSERLDLHRLDRVYEVERDAAPTIALFDDPEQTADGLERHWPGAASAYRAFCERAIARYDDLARLLTADNPQRSLLSTPSLWRNAPFLMRSLDNEMRRSGLPAAVVDALTIWTHVAAMTPQDAPSAMALVPGLIHREGAWLPDGGMRAIPMALLQQAESVGVEVRLGIGVRNITTDGTGVTGVITDDDESVVTRTVIGNAGLATLLQLLDRQVKEEKSLRRLPLQSPGVCLYMAARVRDPSVGHRLRFRLPENGELCRLLIRQQPDVDGWTSSRLLAPMKHAEVERLGDSQVEEFVDRLSGEAWWSNDIEEFEVLAHRTPQDWGNEFRLYRNAMNPAMTSRLMRGGRLGHRTSLNGLYMAGSATHPGQWVSFSMVSGILAANCALQDAA